jgi:hypothetical protein
MTEGARKQREFDEFQMINEKAADTSNFFLKSAVLINGGASIAVLGFVASASQSGLDLKEMVPLVLGALLWFAWGLTASVVSVALAYLTHYAQLVRINNKKTEDETWWTANKRLLHLAAGAGALASIAFFVLGCYAVKEAILAGV